MNVNESELLDGYMIVSGQKVFLVSKKFDYFD